MFVGCRYDRDRERDETCAPRRERKPVLNLRNRRMRRGKGLRRPACEQPLVNPPRTQRERHAARCTPRSASRLHIRRYE